MHGKRLRGEHVLYLGCTYAPRPSPHCAQRTGMAIATYDGHSRHHHAKLRRNHVNDTLTVMSHAVVIDAEFACVLLERPDHFRASGHRRSFGPPSVGGYHMIRDSHCAVGAYKSDRKSTRLNSS